MEELKAKTFNLTDLVGRNLDIIMTQDTGSGDCDVTLISARDTKTNEIFVLNMDINTRVDQSTDKLIDELVEGVESLKYGMSHFVTQEAFNANRKTLGKVLALLNSKRNKEG